MKERKDLIDDALHATRAAAEEGIVPGGGVAFLRAIDAVESAKRQAKADEKLGFDIIAEALRSPARQIADNAGEDGEVVVAEILENKNRRWESLGYGMFIHFGMSTFVGKELPGGQDPSSTYAPDKLDVDQWVQVARDAGMKYAVLTAKHVAGHCLWPSKFTDYDVETSRN